MKDIDFDELDRAVSSLMSGVPKTDDTREDALATVPPVPVSVDDSGPERTHPTPDLTAPERPKEQDDAEQERPKPTSPSTLATPPARRRGQFMDMVRPGAQETKSPNLARPASRHGVTIQPANTSLSQPEAASVDGISPPPKPTSEQTDTSSSTDWPDPLESVDFNKTTEAVSVKANSSSAPSVPPVPAVTPTPFLRDAKVEKRPLGRSSDTDGPSQLAPEPDHAPVLGGLVDPEEESDQSGKDTIPKQPLPVELREDVMAIEADTGSTVDEPLQDAPEVSSLPTRPSATNLGATAPRPVSTSIPQQYKVQPKVADPAPGAIYDTAAYHQPLSHPAKKQPGWFWVVIIFLILLLGAGSGAAVYYLGLV